MIYKIIQGPLCMMFNSNGRAIDGANRLLRR